MPVTNEMHHRLNEVLIASVDVWMDGDDWSSLLGHWRGQNDLLDFVRRFPTRESQQTAGVFPKCLVLAEYCRFALSSDGTDDAIQLLQAQADRILSAPEDFQTGRAGCLVQAITHAVTALRRNTASSTLRRDSVFFSVCGRSATELTSVVYWVLHDQPQRIHVVQRPWNHRGKLGGEEFTSSPCEDDFV